ncbi:MAG: hypothetical protein ACOCXH_00560 [Cyclobacteriaceae bacterium]
MKDTGKNKFNLDEFKNAQVFKTPKGYFEELPQIIQARAIADEAKEREGSWLQVPKVAWQYAIPAVLIILLGTFFLLKSVDQGLAPVEIIAQVDDEAILYYLENEIDLTTEDILESVPQEYFDEDFGSITDGMEDIIIDTEMLEKYGIEQDLVF